MENFTQDSQLNLAVSTIMERLDGQEYRIRLNLFLKRASLYLLGLLGVVGFAIVSDLLWSLPTSIRSILFFGELIFLVIFLFHGVIIPFAFPLSSAAIARILEKTSPALENYLTNAAFFIEYPVMGSTELAQLALIESAEKASKEKPVFSLLPGKTKLLQLILACTIFAMMLICHLSFPLQFNRLLTRFIHPKTNLPVLGKLVFEKGTPGDVILPHGASLEIRTIPHLRDRSPEAVNIILRRYKTSEGVRRGENEKIRKMKSLASGEYAYHFDAVEESFFYSFRSGFSRSRWYHVELVGPPVVKEVCGEIIPPAYTGLPREELQHSHLVGNISIPEGSKINLKISFNRSMQKLDIRLDDNQLLHRFTSECTQADVKFTVNQSVSLRVTGIDRWGIPFSSPFLCRFDITPDNPPSIEIKPGKDPLFAKPGDTIFITGSARDDYGLTFLYLKAGPSPQKEIVVWKTSFNPQRKGRTFVQIPWELTGIFSQPGEEISFFLEAEDNRTPKRQTGFSTTRKLLIASRKDSVTARDHEENIHVKTPPGTTPGGESEKPILSPKGKKVLAKLLSQLRDFLSAQKKVIEHTNNLPSKSPNRYTKQERNKLFQLANIENDWSRFIEESASDLSKLPKQDFSHPVLVKELVEIASELKTAADALEVAAHTIAVSEEQTGLELAEELTAQLEKWLPDTPDRLKWVMEEPSEYPDVPMVELPEELQDIIGELLEEEEDLLDDAEDVSSSWADSLDKGAGWDAADGPISNMSAQGVTGNQLANNTEIGGRSGEGRSGKAHGEMVEDTATGKGGRKTPTRLTPDDFNKGQIKDLSIRPAGGATGGGKVSGVSGEGITGFPVPKEADRVLKRLADRQSSIRRKGEKLKEIPAITLILGEELNRTIRVMSEVEEDFRSGNISAALARRKMLLKDIIELQLAGTHIKAKEERTSFKPPSDLNIRHKRIDKDSLPPAFRKELEEYFRMLAEY